MHARTHARTHAPCPLSSASHRFICYNGAGPPEDQPAADGTPPQRKVFPTRFSPIAGALEQPIILVEFDGEGKGDHPLEAGNHSVSRDIQRLIPICATPGRFAIPGTGCVRWQIPLAPAQARTIHSAQGVTALHGAVVDPGGVFFAGDYVAMSRVKKLIDLYLLKPIEAAFFQMNQGARNAIDAEYLWLDQQFHCDLPIEY